MRTYIIFLTLFLLFINGYSQNSKFEYTGRLTASARKENLNNAHLVTDISTELWSKMRLSGKEHEELNRLRKTYYPLGYYAYPKGGYNVVVRYVSVKISATCNGKILTAESASDELTREQKQILNTVDLGSDIIITIKYKHRLDNEIDSKLYEGHTTVTVVPDVEAQYPGGNKQLTEYLTENIINKTSKTGTIERIQQAIVKFTINEKGQVVDTRIARTSADSQIDRLILDSINKMPKWKPAENSKGAKVRQEFIIQFGGDGC